MDQSTRVSEPAIPLPLRGRWLRYFKSVAFWTLVFVTYCHTLWLAFALPRLGSAKDIQFQVRWQWRFVEEFGTISASRAPAKLDVGPLRVQYIAAARGGRKPLEGALRSWLWLAALALPYVVGCLALRGDRRTRFIWACSGVLLSLHLTCATACGPFGCQPVGLWNLVVEHPYVAGQ